METKEIKIQVPEGYEIDRELSSFEKIVFKKKKNINCWKDLEEIKGYAIDVQSHVIHWSELSAIEENKNVFLNEKYAKSALALAQISQLLPYYNTDDDYNTSHYKYCITRDLNDIVINQWSSTYQLLSFKNKEDAIRFLKYNEQLVKDYFML